MIPASTTAHLRRCALYFLLYMSFGCTHPFLPLIWHSKGLSGYQIGLLGAIWPVTTLFITPVACAYADEYGIHRKMLSVALLARAITRPSILMARNFVTVSIVEVLYAIANGPVKILIDASIRHSFGAEGFGAQRLWGAIGAAVASLIGGFISSSDGGSYGGVMVMFEVLALGTLAASAGISVGIDHSPDECTEGFGSSTRTPIAEKDVGEIEASRLTAEPAIHYSDVTGIEKETIEYGSISKHSTGEGESQDKENLLFTVLSLILGTLENTSFFSAIVLSGMSAGVADTTILFIRLEELGGSPFLCGVALLVKCLAEVPFFYISGQLIRLIGVRVVIISAQTAYFVRYLYYLVLENPWFALPAEALHGLMYAAMRIACLEHAFNIAPVELRTTIRGVVTGLRWGLGFGLGAMLNGVLYSHLGPRLCFRVSSALSSVSFSLLVLPTVYRWRYKRGEIVHIKEKLNESLNEKCKNNVSSNPKDETLHSHLCDKADDN